MSPLGASLGQLPWLWPLRLQKSPDKLLTQTATPADSATGYGGTV